MPKHFRKTKRVNKMTKTHRKRTSKASCVKQTLKKYTSRPSPPYPAAMCIGKEKRGNDGNTYISRVGPNYGPAKWVKVGV